MGIINILSIAKPISIVLIDIPVLIDTVIDTIWCKKV